MATREEGRDILEDWGHHIHTTIYKINNKDILYSTKIYAYVMIYMG